MVVVSTHSSVRTAAADSKAPARIAKVAKNEQRIAFYSGLAALGEAKMRPIILSSLYYTCTLSHSP